MCERGGRTQVTLPASFALLTPLQRLSVLALLLAENDSVVSDRTSLRIINDPR